MTPFNHTTPIKTLKYGCFFIAVIVMLTACASTMEVNINVPPIKNSNASVNQTVSSNIGTDHRNLLVLIIQGESNKQFVSASPYDLGIRLLKHPLDYQLFPITNEGGDYSFEVTVDPEKSVSVYVLGKDVSYKGASQWKYYYNKYDEDTLNLTFSENGVIKKDKASEGWF